MRPAVLFLLLAFAAATLPSHGQTPPPAIIRIATPGNDGNALAYYAQDMGFFKQAGIDASVQALRAGSGSGVAAAVAGGSVDVGESDIVAIAAAREHGIPLTLLSPSFQHRSSSPISALVVAKAGDVRSAPDLDGKVIAEPSLTGPAKIATVMWLTRNGADVKSIRFVEMPQISMAAAVTRGTVAGAVTTEPNLTASLADVRVLGYVYDAIGKTVQVTAWFSSENWVKSNPEVAKRFVEAMHATAVWANNPRNHRQSGVILSKYIQFPTGLLDTMHRATYGETFDVSIMQPLLDDAYDQRSLAERFQAADLLNPLALVKR